MENIQNENSMKNYIFDQFLLPLDCKQTVDIFTGKKNDNKPVLLVNSSKLGKAPWEWLRNLDMELLEPTTSTPGWLFPIWSDFFLFIKLELNLFLICLVTEDFRYFSWTALILDFNEE